MSQQQQQQQTSPKGEGTPQKNKPKKKKKVKQGAGQQGKQQASSASVGQGGQSSSKKKRKSNATQPSVKATGKKFKRKRPKERGTQPSTGEQTSDMYGEELPVPPSSHQSGSSMVKGKQRAQQRSRATGEMNNDEEVDELWDDDEEVDELCSDGPADGLDGLFFVDTAPAKLPRDVRGIHKPVIKPRNPPPRSPPLLEEESSPSSRSQSPSNVPLEGKVVPDYVGSSGEIKDATVVKDDGFVQGSSKDLLIATVNHHPDETATDGVKAIGNKLKTVDVSSDSGMPVDTSPGGTKRKRDDNQASQIAEIKVPNGTGMLLADLSSDESSSSEEEAKKQRVHENQSFEDSHSDGDSSVHDDGTTDNLALNMEDGTSRNRKSASPQLEMQVDLSGTPVPADAGNASAPAGSKAVHSTANTGSNETAVASEKIANGSIADIDIDMEGSEDDEYHVDRSRYFKEEDPLKVCARCGETGHTVRDCVHVQCLTCGRLDDHGSRSCPLTMQCFQCGQKGHPWQKCPLSPEEARRAGKQFCERCSSRSHNSLTCPYIWRVYIRAANAPVKLPKVHPSCYNCASGDHFGDDCKFPINSDYSTERSAFTMDPDDNRRTHIRFAANSGPYRPAPRLDPIESRLQAEAPPSHAPRGARAMPRMTDRGDQKTPQSENKRASLDDILYSLEQERRKTGDFGNLGNLDAGEVDEDGDAFEKRLRDNEQSAKQPSNRHVGARDRRRAREQGGSNNSSVNGDMEPKKTFQPFKNFKELPPLPPPHGGSLNRPRSMSRSPPPPSRRRDARQASPIAMDSPAQARSAANWQKTRGLQDRLHPGRNSGRGGFASGSLLDRIDRGSINSEREAPASRDPRHFDRRDSMRDDYEGGHRDSRNYRRGGDSYVPDAEARRGGNPRYRGGYF